MESFVRLFFMQGQEADLERAYLANPQETARLIFYWRDRNKGLGLRNLFYLAFRYLVLRDPSFLRLLTKVPVYGCWKDLVVLAGMIPQALETIAIIFALQLHKDQLAMRQGKHVTTAAKWFPSSHAARGRSALTQRVQELLEVTEEQMRRTYLSPLRHYLQIAERQLSTHQLVNYQRTTRGANQRYAQTFRRRDSNWTAPIPPPRTLLEVVSNVLAGHSFEMDRYWERCRGSVSAVGIAVVCDPRMVEPVYPITFALAAGKAGVYTYSDPSILLNLPVESSLALRVAMLQAVRTGPILGLSTITAPCIIVVTAQPFPEPAPQLAPGQRLVWWRQGAKVTVTEHSAWHVEICGFTPKLFSALCKGHIPALAHVVESTLEKYTDIA